MLVEFIKTWVRRVYKNVSEMMSHIGFSWQALGNIAIQETLLTVLTVTVSVLMMRTFGTA